MEVVRIITATNENTRNTKIVLSIYADNSWVEETYAGDNLVYVTNNTGCSCELIYKNGLIISIDNYGIVQIFEEGGDVFPDIDVKYELKEYPAPITTDVSVIIANFIDTLSFNGYTITE